MANLLTNGTFTSNLSSWQQSPSGAAVWVDGEAELTTSAGVTVTLYQNGFAISSGTQYRLTFTCRSTINNSKIRVQVATDAAANTPIGLDEQVTVTTSSATYQVTFIATTTTANARFRFRRSSSDGTVFYIDNVVLEATGAISANFTADPVAGTAPLDVDFTDSSTGSPNDWSYEYSKDGGAWTEFATTQHPTYEFAQTGTYGIRLTASDGVNSDTLTRSDYIVVSGGISADFSGTPTSGAITLNVIFTDASTSTNGIDAWVWEYNRNGAGWVQFSTSQNPSYGFTQGGTYDIRLTITGDDGTSTYTRTGYISATGGVVAGFTATPLNGSAPLTVAFTDSSTGSITARDWEYRRNNGNWTLFSSATNPSFQFTRSGTYDIRLTASSSSTTDTLSRLAYVTVTGSDTIMVTIYNDVGAVAGSLSSTYAFDVETDYYIVASYDQASGLAALYINGELDTSENLGIINLDGQIGDMIYVGQHGSLYNANLLVDDLFFLNRAIEADEVRAVFESNAPVFAETSTWHWRAGRNRLWADAEGLWLVNASGTKVIGAYAGDENDPVAFKTWGGVNLSESDVLIGDASRGGYMLWDDSAGTLTVSGAINVVSGNAAKIDFSNITATLDAVEDGAVYKRTTTNEKAGAGRAYSGLDASNVLVTKVVPATAAGNPSVAGLYLGSDKMGYHTGNGSASGWKTYMDSSGNMLLLGNASNNYIQWVAASNKLQGVGSSIEQWYADATDGRFKAGGGNVILSSDGISVVGDTFLRLYENSSTLKGYLYSSNPLDSLLVNSTGLGIRTNGTATAESLSLRANASGGRSTEIAIESTANASTNRVRILAYSGSAITSSQLTLSETVFSLAIGDTSAVDFSIDVNGVVSLSNNMDVNAHSLIDVGRIGVNEISPDYGLHITGDASTTHALVKLENTATNAHDYWLYAGWNTTGFGIYDETSAAYYLTIDTDGYVNLNRLGAAWTGLSFGSGWTDFSGSFQAGQYKRFGDMVWMRGLVKRTSGSSATIATLPSGFRPSTIVRFGVDTDTGHGAVEVSTGGVVELKSGGTTFVQLEGLVFSVL